jgi:hypothetical protein
MHNFGPGKVQWAGLLSIVRLREEDVKENYSGL